MPVPPDFRDHAYKLFTQEVPDLLQAIESDLLTLVQERSLGKIHNLMRTAHSIKGGAASVGLEAIASLAHRLENIFKALYSDKLEIDTSLEGQLLQAYDCLRLPLMQQVVMGGFDAEHALAAAEPAFAQIEATLGDILQQIDHYDIPTSAQLGVDMTLSILEIDVSEQLERLTAAIATAQVDRVEAELRSQIAILIELAEILNKPGLGKIATVVLDAVNAHPSQVLQIAPLALANFQDYRQVLLVSQGRDEMAPAEALLAWVENEPDAFEVAADPIVISGELTGKFTGLEPIPEETLTAFLRDIDTSFETIPETTIGTASETNQPGLDSLAEIIETLEEIQYQNIDPIEALNLPTQIHPKDIPIASPVTTRVDSEQLEQMNNLVNEAVIKRSGLSLQNEQMQKTVRDLLNRLTAVEQIVAQLRKVSDRTLILPPRQEYRAPVETQADGSLTRAGHFDSLELDHYGALHSLLQPFLEDMIQLRESADDVALFARRSDKGLTELRKSLNHLQDDFIWVRMLPIGEVLNRFPRILRDLTITYKKPVKLQLSGTEVLVDRAVIEHLYDPLLHLLRNAFDHGIEHPHIRRQRGKPEQGLIQIKSFYRGGQTIIEVKDDGEGLNLERIGRRAIELGILSAKQLAATADDCLCNLIFAPGFSTAAQVNELSGRGVGLDVVRTQLSYLKGSIAVTSQPGVGTTFTLRLPLTLTSDKLLIGLAGFTALALPSDSVHEIFVPRADQVIQVGEQEFLQWRREVFPIYRLVNLLEYAGPGPEAPSLDALITKSAAQPKPASAPEPRTLIIISWRQKFAALEVDQLVTEQKLVIKPFGTLIAPPHCIYGCTILGDGSVVPVVDGAALIDQALERQAKRKGLPSLSLPASGAEKGTTAKARGTTFSSQPTDDRSTTDPPTTDRSSTTQRRSSAKILVVDDAVALRQTLALTLESVGYQVLQAGDGWEAVRQLLFNPDTALVISDIEMPNMNGFDFMNYRRREATLEKIPLVILTSRSNDKHRRLAMHLGATSYFTKPYIEKALLQEIQNIVQVFRGND